MIDKSVLKKELRYYNSISDLRKAFGVLEFIERLS